MPRKSWRRSIGTSIPIAGSARARNPPLTNSSPTTDTWHEFSVTLECEVVRTRSGAPAMLDRTTGEVMHPLVGPRVEAERLYIGPSRLALRLCEPEREPDAGTAL